MLTDVEARLPTCRRPALFGLADWSLFPSTSVESWRPFFRRSPCPKQWEV